MTLKNLLSIGVNSNRVYGLDVLRAVAILTLVWGHGAHFLPDNARKTYDIITLDGVSIFFVLSGFLIGGILIKILEQKRSDFYGLWNFWIRRWLRTLPAYFFVLTLMALIYMKVAPDFSFYSIKSYYVFLQNFDKPHPDFFGEAWSLSVEEWFYLIAPASSVAVIGLFRLKPRHAILLIAVLILLTVTGYRYYKYMKMPPSTIWEWDVNFRKQVITRLDSLMFGVVGAYILFYAKSYWIKYKNLLFIVGICLLIGQQFFRPGTPGLYLSVFSFSVFSLSILLVLPFLSEWKSGSGKISKYVTHISLISYSIYLTNFGLVQKFIIKDLLQRKVYDRFDLKSSRLDVINYGLFWILTMVISTLMYKYLEVPCMNLRDKIKYGSLQRFISKVAVVAKRSA